MASDTTPGVRRSKPLASGSTRETEVGKTTVRTPSALVTCSVLPLGTSRFVLVRYEPMQEVASCCTCLVVSLIRSCEPRPKRVTGTQQARSSFLGSPSFRVRSIRCWMEFARSHHHWPSRRRQVDAAPGALFDFELDQDPNRAAGLKF